MTPALGKGDEPGGSLRVYSRSREFLSVRGRVGKDEKSPEQVSSQMATKTAIPMMAIRIVCVERSNGCDSLMDVIMKTMPQTGCEERDER